MREKGSAVALNTLAVTWGPVLLDPSGADDVRVAVRVVETIVRHFERIFEME